MKKTTTPLEAATKNQKANNNETHAILIERTKNVLKEITQPSSARVFKYALDNPHSSTGEIAHRCLVGNVSDAVIKMKPILRKHGLTMFCYLPKPMIKNCFNEKSQVHRWVIATIEQGANHA